MNRNPYPTPLVFDPLFGSIFHSKIFKELSMTKTTSHKPFNLEAAKRGEPITNAQGQEVKFVAYAEGATDGYPLLCLVKGSVQGYTPDGKFYSTTTPSPRDLYMAVVKKEGWVNITREGATVCRAKAMPGRSLGSDAIFPTRQAAIDGRGGFVYGLGATYIGEPIRIEWYE